MELDRSYILPGIYSIGLHVLILLLLLWHFEHSKLDILKPQQRIVESVQVQSSDLKKIDKQIAEQKKTKPKAEETPKPTAPPEKAIAIEKPTDKPKPTQPPKPKPTPKPKPEKSKVDDLLKEAKAETTAKPKPKPSAPPTDQAPNAPDDPTSGALDGDEDVAKIKSKIESNWSQPASYQKGMKALLVVDLLPTGEVLNIEIKESSGDSGFDNSAEVAVRKSSPLPVPQDPKRFEAYFRKFNFLFCPDCTDNNF